MGPQRIGDYNFEVLVCSQNDPLYEATPYYVSIRDKVGTPLCDTFLTHRFEKQAQALTFCHSVANGTRPIRQIMKEAQAAFEIWNKNQSNIAVQSIDAFLSQVQALGISQEQLKGVFAAYDRLPAEARKLVRDEALLKRYARDYPVPDRTPHQDPISFGAWLETTKTDVDVCLVDKDTGEHDLNAVCYLSEDDRKDPDLQYSDLEQWLFTLPVDHVLNQDGCQLVVVNTDFTIEQTDFLLGHSVDGFESREMSNLFHRANWADADFSARLAYLQNGTPFEVPFDSTCMDSADPNERRELCTFLSAHPNAYIVPAAADGLYVVYCVEPNQVGTLHQEDCAVCARKTEPGKGIAFTLEGKLYRAQNKITQPQIPSDSAPVIHPAQRG